MPTTLEHAFKEKSTKLLILLPLRTIYFRTLQFETPFKTITYDEQSTFIGQQGFFEILMITLISSKKLGVYKIMRNTVTAHRSGIYPFFIHFICIRLYKQTETILYHFGALHYPLIRKSMVICCNLSKLPFRFIECMKSLKKCF